MRAKTSVFSSQLGGLIRKDIWLDEKKVYSAKTAGLIAIVIENPQPRVAIPEGFAVP